MNALGMIVDVSHCSKQTTLDAAAPVDKANHRYPCERRGAHLGNSQ